MSSVRSFSPLRLSAVLSLLPIFIAVPAISWGQAVVNESLETAAIYVDTVHGSDSNNGSQSAPLKTIGASVTKAIANNHSSIGSKRVR